MTVKTNDFESYREYYKRMRRQQELPCPTPNNEELAKWFKENTRATVTFLDDEVLIDFRGGAGFYD